VRSSLIALALIVAGCSSSKSGANACGPGCGAPNHGTDGGVDAGPADPTPQNSCVKRGQHGNDKGVGEYCTPGGTECDAFSSTAPFCLAKLTTEDQWFCTRVGCTSDDQCGAGAYCLHNPAGTACVLNRCQPKDAGASHD